MKRRRQLTPMYIGLVVFSIVCMGILLWMFFNGQKFKNYSNAELGFSLKYPANWSLEENKNGAAVIFYAPLSNDLDMFQENVNVVVRNEENSQMSLGEYSRLAIEQLKMVFQENIVIVENKDRRLSGLPGHVFVFIGKGVEADLKYYCLWTMKGNKSYQVTFTSLETEYDKYISLVNRIVSSFRISQR